MLRIALSLAAAACAFSATAQADYKIVCESQNNSYRTCPLPEHGYVKVHKQLSQTKCVQGRNWDYDKRNIWVDDGCRAEFRLEARAHSSSSKDKAAEAAAAIAALALLAATANHKDSHDRYDDREYYHPGHSSYVPGWMEGRFYGQNRGTNVDMTISEDGRVSAHIGRQKVTGYVNDERLYVGDLEFYLTRTSEGFMSSQVGNPGNIVYYRRY